MITTTDEQTLTRLLGCDALPENVRQECELRTSWYHRGGASGPIGLMPLIEMLRSLGLKPPVVKMKDGVIDWRSVPQDGSVRVEAGPLFNQFHPGRFKGFGPDGMILVFLEEDRRVMPFRRDMVRMAGEQPRVVDAISDMGKPDARVSLLKEAEAAVESIAPQPKAETVAPASPTPEPDPITPEEFDFEQDEEGPFDWRAVEIGKPVYAVIGEEPVEGTFQGMQDDTGKIFVKLTGKPGPRRALDAQLVTYAG